MIENCQEEVTNVGCKIAVLIWIYMQIDFFVVLSRQSSSQSKARPGALEKGLMYGGWGGQSERGKILLISMWKKNASDKKVTQPW